MATSALRRSVSILGRALAIATIAGLLMSARVSSTEVSWAVSLGRSLSYTYAWGACGLVIIGCDRVILRRSHSLGAGLLWHIPLSLVMVVASLFLVQIFSWLLAVPTTPHPLSLETVTRALRWGVAGQLVPYTAILGASRAFDYYARYRERAVRASDLETLLARAQLETLRVQLEPHFLFNALNTISAHVEESPRAARRMIEELGQLLRHSIDRRHQQEVSLSEELGILSHYLAIQQARFEDRLVIEQRIAEGTRTALVPALILQPLVENALQHGLTPRAAGGCLMIEATRDGDHLRLRVVDDGVGLPDAGAASANGRGLSLTRQRLERLYPEGGGRLEVRGGKDSGVVAEIVIPWRTQPTGEA